MSNNKCRVEVFSRVVGFFRPVQSWNEGKQEEFKDRKEYSVDVVEISGKNENTNSAESLIG